MPVDGLGEACGRGAGHTCWPVAELWSHAGSPPCAPPPVFAQPVYWHLVCLVYTLQRGSCCCRYRDISHKALRLDPPGSRHRAAGALPKSKHCWNQEGQQGRPPCFPASATPCVPWFLPGGFLALQLIFVTVILSLQMDHDPRSPAYIATQGPLPATVADFWQVSLL